MKQLKSFGIGEKMARRHLLRGLGAGLALLAPFAQTRLIRAQASSAANLLVFFTPNGFLRSKFGAENPGANFSFKPSLAALESVKANVTVIQGLCNKSVSEKSSHEDCVKILTCASGDDLYRGYGPSIDQVVAKHLGGRPLTLAVEKFNDEPNWQTKLSWVADNAFEPHVKNAKTVFDNVFGNFTPLASDPATPRPLDPRFAQNKSVLDFVRTDIGIFKSRLSAADRAKLELHLESLREVEKRVAVPPPGTGSATAQCELSGLAERASQGMTGNEVQELQTQGELMVDLTATSFACGIKRSATLFWQPASGGINPNQGGGNHHQVSHYEAPSSQEQWQKIDAWYAEQFRYTIEALSARGVLDDTVLVWATEIAEAHHQNNFVMLLAGGKNLGFKLGQYIEYPFYGDEDGKVATARDSRNKSQADLWVSIQKAFGIDSDTFGDPQYSSGGLSELRPA